MPDKGESVLVGMSGGVDSSAVCMLLQEQGYRVVGLTLRIWDIPAHFPNPGQTEPQHIIEARELAMHLGIPHHTLDVREPFRELVIKNFTDEYMQGRTPNPCVLCNLHFKWYYLLAEADRLRCDKVATGHYARIESDDNDRLCVACGLDQKKDQSYFLWRLGQRELRRTLFPLGGLSKEEIKAYVTVRGYREKAVKKESMEVCFVADDYRTFLREQIPGLDAKVAGGYFVDIQGKKLGMHRGFPFYTVGQRKGLSIAMGYPAYVVKINAEKNTIRLGRVEELETQTMLIEELDSISDELYRCDDLTVRIRYRSQPLQARITPVSEREALVTFAATASAVTPGQSAVFYRGDRVVGGALIASQRKLKKYSHL